MEKWIIDEGVERIEQTLQEPHTDRLSFIGPISGGGKIRTAFSKLTISHLAEHISDIGNMSYAAKGQIDNILSELSESYPPVVICTSDQGLDSFKDTYWALYNHPVTISNRPRVDYPEMNYIGLQKHLCPISFDWTSIKHLRLGAVKHDLSKAEVYLRNADTIVLDLASLKLSDNLGGLHNNTAGLHIEELCTIARYIGASTQLKSVIITGYDQNNDSYGMMANNIALLLYYIAEGYEIRKREAASQINMTRYAVLPEDHMSEIVFLEDPRSKRWWVEVYSDAAEETVLMPCTQKDYEAARSNIISERMTHLLAMT